MSYLQRENSTPIAKQLRSGKWKLEHNLQKHYGGITGRKIVSITTPNVTGRRHKTENFIYRGNVLECAQVVMEIYEHGESYISLNDGTTLHKHNFKKAPKLINDTIKFGPSIVLQFKNSTKAKRVYSFFRLDEDDI